MADEIDKFVLQYQVELKDSISRLEKLNEKMNEVEKKGSDSQSGVSKWTKQFQKVKGEIVGASSSLEGFAGAVGKMPIKFLGVAAAVAAVGAAIKIASAAAEEFREQRETGNKVGLGELNVERLQRRFSRASGGRVGAAETRGNVEQIANFQESAFTDVTGTGRENIILRKLGLKAGRDIDKFIEDIQTKFAGMTEEQARAYGDLLGLSRNFTDSLRAAGKSQEDLGKMTEAEAQRTVKASQATRELDQAMSSIGESFRKMKHEVGDLLLPVLSKGAEGFAKISEGIEKGVNGLTSWLPAAFRVAGKQVEAAYNVVSGKDTLEHATKEVNDAAKEESDKMNNKVSEETLKAAKEQNNSTRQMNMQLKRDINLFSGAVHTFANAIDQQQAWAAWAGEIGRAAGLGTPENIAAPGGTSAAMPAGKTSEFDHIFKEAAEKYGRGMFDAADLKAQAIIESRLNPNAKSPSGAVGIMQLMKGTAADLGVMDRKDPRQSIMGGARYLAQMFDKAGGNKELAYQLYNRGPNSTAAQRNNSETQSYYSKIQAARGSSDIRYGGQSKNRLRRSMAESEIASQLGFDTKQLQRGEVSRGDVEWRIQQLQAKGQNEITRLKNFIQYNALATPMQKQQAQNQLKAQEVGLKSLAQYGPTIAGYSREGGREVTIGELKVEVAVGGTNASAQDIGTAVGQGVSEHLKSEGGQVVNDRSFPLKN